MKKAKVLLLVLAVLLLCTACAEVAAAPEPTPTLVPIPTPVGTPDPVWRDLQAGLRKNTSICLVDQFQVEATLLTGPVVTTKLIWVTSELTFHIVTVAETRKSRVGYERFVIDSEKDLTRFDRVFVYTAIGEREWEFGFPVAFCQPTP